MVLSRSVEYAVRAAIFLAGQKPGTLVMAKEIADKTGIPGHFLAKLLQKMARRGLLRSNKGPTGGFALARAAGQVTLIEIMRALDEADNILRCPMGEKPCQPALGCAMHESWQIARAPIVNFLENTNLAEIAVPPPSIVQP